MKGKFFAQYADSFSPEFVHSHSTCSRNFYNPKKFAWTRRMQFLQSGSSRKIQKNSTQNTEKIHGFIIFFQKISLDK